jgi:hypothetical protein
MVTQKHVVEILRIGTAAISPYNTQPWRFRIVDDRVEVFIVRTKNFFLKLQGVSHLTLGCLLENLESGARHTGYRPVTQFYDRALGLDEPCAIVELVPHPSKSGSDISHLLGRSTNRKPYQRCPLPDEVRERILSIADEDNVTVFFSEGEQQAELARILADLELVRLSNYKMTREAIEYIRLDAAEMAAKPEGLDVRTLEFDSRIVKMLGPIQRRRVHGVLKLLGMVRMATRRHHEQLLKSSAIVTYAIEDREPASFVGLGRIIQRTLNSLTEMGVESMSVLSGLYLLDVLRTNPEIFSRAETKMLMRTRQAFEEFFDSSERNLVYIVRVGYADPPSARQRRRALEELILGN